MLEVHYQTIDTEIYYHFLENKTADMCAEIRGNRTNLTYQ